MDAAFYMVISGKLHDTGLLHRHRLRLILLRFHHHLPQRLLRDFYAAASLVHFLTQVGVSKNSAFMISQMYA